MTLCAGKFCVQECIHDLHCQPRSYYAAAECEHVCIVVLSCGFCAETVGTEGSPDTRHFICRNGDTDSGAADQDAFVTASVFNGRSYLAGIHRVIHCICTVAAKIYIGDLLFIQVF